MDDLLVVRVESWPRGRRDSAKLKAIMKLRPRGAKSFNVELSYSGVPTRPRSTHTVFATNPRDLWLLIYEALWPIGHNEEVDGSIIIDVEATRREA